MTVRFYIVPCACILVLVAFLASIPFWPYWLVATFLACSAFSCAITAYLIARVDCITPAERARRREMAEMWKNEIPIVLEKVRQRNRIHVITKGKSQ